MFNPQLSTDTHNYLWILHAKYSLPNTKDGLFPHFQHADSKLVVPLLMTAPILTVTAANKKMKQVEKTQIEKW